MASALGSGLLLPRTGVEAEQSLGCGGRHRRVAVFALGLVRASVTETSCRRARLLRSRIPSTEAAEAPRAPSAPGRWSPISTCCRGSSGSTASWARRSPARRSIVSMFRRWAGLRGWGFVGAVAKEGDPLAVYRHSHQAFAAESAHAARRGPSLSLTSGIPPGMSQSGRVPSCAASGFAADDRDLPRGPAVVGGPRGPPQASSRVGDTRRAVGRQVELSSRPHFIARLHDRRREQLARGPAVGVTGYSASSLTVISEDDFHCFQPGSGTLGDRPGAGLVGDAYGKSLTSVPLKRRSGEGVVRRT